MSKKAIIALAVAAGLIGLVAGQFIKQYIYPNIGVIRNPSLELYIDDSLYTNNTAIDWYDCLAGEEYFIENMTVLNTGDTGLTVYIVPYGLPAGWTVAWQGNDTALSPSQKVEGWLNLTISVGATSWPDWGFYLRGE